MSMTTPLDLDWDPTPQPGWVSPVCRFTDTDGVRFVLVREVVAVCYDLADRNTERCHEQKRENQNCKGFSLFHFAVSFGPRPL